MKKRVVNEKAKVDVFLYRNNDVAETSCCASETSFYVFSPPTRDNLHERGFEACKKKKISEESSYKVPL